MQHPKQYELVVVVPVYNEVKLIQQFTEDWVQLLNQLNIRYCIRFYNDGSTDGSAVLLNELARTNTAIQVIHKQNSGHGATLLQAYKEAVDAEWIFQVDSDHELDHTVFSVFWRNRQLYDVLLGERIKEKQTGLFRKLLSAVSALSLRVFFGKGINDSNCPYRLMHASALQQALLQIPEKCFAPNVLLSAVFVSTKKQIKTIPLKQNFRKPRSGSGFSMLMLKGAVNTFLYLLKLKIVITK